ncbi:membrane hypothetical protein [Azospirillaceae bacterium]
MPCYYPIGEIELFRKISFFQSMSIIDIGGPKRFSPLGFGLIGYINLHYFNSSLLLPSTPLNSLNDAGGVIWLHPVLCSISCMIIGLVVWKLFRNILVAIAAMCLVGMSDTVLFQIRYVNTLVCYELQIATTLAIYYLLRLEERSDAWSAVAVSACVGWSLGVWEQGLDLGGAVAACLVIRIVLELKSKKWDRLKLRADALALFLVLVILLFYLYIRIPAGVEEALSINKEASYFFSYGKPLLMIDDFFLNIGALSLQWFRQLLPKPPVAFSIIQNIDMTVLNPYNNGGYTTYPGMPYRFMGLWYAGLAFATYIILIAYFIREAARSSGMMRATIVAALAFFVFGLSTHLFIMHRDYYYLPGYAVGYKISIAYIGFVVLMALLARKAVLSSWFLGLNQWGRHIMISAAAIYFVGGAISRIIIQRGLPLTFQW